MKNNLLKFSTLHASTVPCGSLGTGDPLYLYTDESDSTRNFEPRFGAGLLTPFTSQHTIALGRAARGGAPCSTSCVERSDWSPCRTVSDDRSLGRDPVGASARRVALCSAGQLGRLQTPWRQEKNSMSRLEK